MLEAKECFFNGYPMRSLAERSWALMLDRLGVRFQYEPAVFRTERHGGYLPDFYIPAADAFFEVKGLHPTQVEIEKAEDLMRSTGKLVVFGYAKACVGVFDGRRLPMGAMLLVPADGRWIKVPLTVIGELVYAVLGQLAGLKLAQAVDEGCRHDDLLGTFDAPGGTPEGERMRADECGPLNAAVVADHRAASHAEIAIAAAAAEVIARGAYAFTGGAKAVERMTTCMEAAA